MSLRHPLVDIEELFSHTFSSLIHNFQYRQRRALIYGVVLLTDRVDLYKIQWTFISRVPYGEYRAKEN